MNEPTTLGAYLRRERERRELTLRTISESTKVSLALLEGLEADDISRWPGGIFRRAFVRSYAQCVGLDPDDVVKRFEQQHPPPDAVPPPIALGPSREASAGGSGGLYAPFVTAPLPTVQAPAPGRARVLGTLADLTVASVLAFGSAAAGSRLLWPVLLIAAYYATGVLVTGTSPMVALLSDRGDPTPIGPRTDLPSRATIPDAPSAVASRRPQPRRTNERPRQRRGAQARA